MPKKARRSDTVFYAYPSRPPSVDETLNNAAKYVATFPAFRSSLRIKLWPDLSVSGRRIVDQITQSIDREDVFACDLTFPNLNVAFELGYAIGRLKRIWVSLDTSIKGANRSFQRLYSGIVPAGYAEYVNHRELGDALMSDQPWSTPHDTLLSDSYSAHAPRAEQPALLYVKPPIETDAVIAVGERLASSIFSARTTIDDPRENPSPTLEWYADKAYRCDAVLVHLLSPSHSGAENHNVKASFVAGLAHAFKKHVFMLAHAPFQSPVDYRNLLASHATAKQARSALDRWLREIEPGLPRRRPRRIAEPMSAVTRLDLRMISVGEPVAEHESQILDEYFVETSHYYAALESQTAILVGRRGTGKTANLFALENTLKSDKRNHVCVMKPVGYEMDGLVRLLNENIHRAEQGYLIESLWKFLVYSELACGVSEGITSRPSYQVPNQHESALVAYVEDHSHVLCTPFSERINSAVNSLVGLEAIQEPQEQRARISELLHLNELHELRALLGRVLHDRNKVSVLIDNLDEPWHPGRDISAQAALLTGLLSVATDITDEFHREDRWRSPVNLSVTIFLRSDIFAHIHGLVREQDKLPLHRIIWNDKEVLLRVLNQRLAYGLPTNFDSAQVWRELFPAEVVGLPVFEFLTANTLARPRDLIYLVKEAIASAVNRGHAAVTDDDLLEARRRYSEYAFRSLLAEDDPTKGHMEAVLYEFAGAKRILGEPEVRTRIEMAGVEGIEVPFYLDLLCDVTFLGIQTADGHRFCTDEGDRKMLREVALRLAQNESREQSYEINAAFYQVLQIE